jgi:hypothetical protein
MGWPHVGQRGGRISVRIAPGLGRRHWRGLIGSTGLSNHPHLHIEVRWLTVPYNPSRDSAGQGVPVEQARDEGFVDAVHQVRQQRIGAHQRRPQFVKVRRLVPGFPMNLGRRHHAAEVEKAENAIKTPEPEAIQVTKVEVEEVNESLKFLCNVIEKQKNQIRDLEAKLDNIPVHKGVVVSNSSGQIGKEPQKLSPIAGILRAHGIK